MIQWHLETPILSTTPNSFIYNGWFDPCTKTRPLTLWKKKIQVLIRRKHFPRAPIRGLGSSLPKESVIRKLKKLYLYICSPISNHHVFSGVNTQFLCFLSKQLLNFRPKKKKKKNPTGTNPTVSRGSQGYHMAKGLEAPPWRHEHLSDSSVV